MNVWTYWAGPKSKWIDTCLKSIERCCKASTFYLLTPDNVMEAALCRSSALFARFKELPPGVGTDYLRASLLLNHGGLWIDADTICIEDPARLVTDRHDPKQFLYSKWNDGRPIAGYVYSPRNHPIAACWLEIVEAKLRHSRTIGWGDIGERSLALALRGSEGCHDWLWEMPRETFLPINIDENAGRYFQHSGWRDFATPNTIAFGLNCSWMMEHKRAEMGAEARGSSLMIHQLLWEAERDNA